MHCIIKIFKSGWSQTVIGWQQVFTELDRYQDLNPWPLSYESTILPRGFKNGSLFPQIKNCLRMLLCFPDWHRSQRKFIQKKFKKNELQAWFEFSASLVFLLSPPPRPKTLLKNFHHPENIGQVGNVEFWGFSQFVVNAMKLFEGKPGSRNFTEVQRIWDTLLI